MGAEGEMYSNWNLGKNIRRARMSQKHKPYATLDSRCQFLPKRGPSADQGGRTGSDRNVSRGLIVTT